MHNTFPDTPVYTGYNAPGRFEGEIHDLEVVSGEVPKELAGTFFRVGPDPAYPPKLGSDIHFNGDGIVTAFTFKNGHVDFKARYAETDKFKLERAARKVPPGAFRVIRCLEQAGLLEATDGGGDARKETIEVRRLDHVLPDLVKSLGATRVFLKMVGVDPARWRGLVRH